MHDKRKPNKTVKAFTVTTACTATFAVASLIPLNIIAGFSGLTTSFFEAAGDTHIPFAVAAATKILDLATGSPETNRNIGAAIISMKGHHDMESDYLLRKTKRDIDEKKVHEHMKNDSMLSVKLSYDFAAEILDGKSLGKIEKMFPYVLEENYQTSALDIARFCNNVSGLQHIETNVKNPATDNYAPRITTGTSSCLGY